jgi:hypothetical protein
MGDLADKQIKNEELFAENEKRFLMLAEAQRRADSRMERLEGSYELLESFVRDFRAETRDYFTETDKRLAALVEAQARTDEQIRHILSRNGSAKPKKKAAAKTPSAKAAKKSKKGATK